MNKLNGDSRFKNFQTECEYTTGSTACGLNRDILCSINNCRIISEKIKEDLLMSRPDESKMESQDARIPKDYSEQRTEKEPINNVGANISGGSRVLHITNVNKNVKPNLKYGMSEQEVILELKSSCDKMSLVLEMCVEYIQELEKRIVED